jgi:hypothetical protein
MVAFLMATSFFQAGQATERVDSDKTGKSISVLKPLLLLAGLASQGDALPQPYLGEPFLMNKGEPLSREDGASIVTTVLSDGNLASAWFSSNRSQVVSQIFTPTGEIISREFTVNDSPLDSITVPVISGCPDEGLFTVAWKDKNYIHARILSRSGPVTAPFAVAWSCPSCAIDSPHVACLSGAKEGKFVFVWDQQEEVSRTTGSFGCVYSSKGEALTKEFPINQFITNQEGKPFVLALNDKEFFVSWGREWFKRIDILGRSFWVNGVPRSDETVMGIARSTKFSKTAQLANGDIILLSNPDETGSDGVLDSVFIRYGAPLPGEFPITKTAKSFGISSAGNGALVTWNEGTGGKALGTFLSSDGDFLTDHFTISPVADTVFLTRLTEDNTFLVAWSRAEEDGASAIYGREVSLREPTQAPTPFPTPTSSASRLTPWSDFFTKNILHMLGKASNLVSSFFQ